MTDEIKDKNLRPLLHIAGKRGWINDPNGLIKFRGEYHAFFQYHPEGVVWGPIRWGHVKSRDLIKWEYLPDAIVPEEEDGCFSGTAIAHGGRLYIMYTSFKENGGGESVRQLQALASSADGVHFEKHGIVIGEKDLPPEYSPADFRDPKILRHGKTFYCLAAARKRDGRGRIIVFSSSDLFHWKFVGDLLNRDSGGIMIECPDYNEKLRLLTYCEQLQPAQGFKHLNIYSTFYRLGKIDFETGAGKFGNDDIIDYGFDFYAAQTFAGARIMLGWLGMWERDFPYSENGFAGMLTVPRKLKIKGGKLWQSPIYHGGKVKFSREKALFDRAKTGVLEIALKGLKSFCLTLRKKENQGTKIFADENTLTFDRSQSGKSISGKEGDKLSRAGIRKMPLGSGKAHKITVVFDLFSVEIFADGLALSSVVCPDFDADEIVFKADAKRCVYKRFAVDKTGL